MTKAEVVFDGDKIIVNGKHIEMDWHYECFKAWDGREFFNIEQAIKYCLENKQ